MTKGKDVITIYKEALDNSVILIIKDHVGPDSKRALRMLRKAIKDTDFPNKEIYANACYQTDLRMAATYEINSDIAQAIIKNLEAKYDIIIKEVI